MKYIITENQLNFLEEAIHRYGGRYNADPLGDFFTELNQRSLKKKDCVSAFKKYYSKIGEYIDNISDGQILDYFQEISENPTKGGALYSKNFYKKDILAGFAYFIAKKFIGLNEGEGGIEYILSGKGDRAYFFFDPDFKIFVGGISVTKNDDIKGESYEVGTAAVEKELIGGRYGLKMYLTIISNVDYLSSSIILYTGSFRMWSKSLPKYVNVWAVNEHNYPSRNYKKLTGEETSIPKNTSYFLASRHHNEIKFKR